VFARPTPSLRMHLIIEHVGLDCACIGFHSVCSSCRGLQHVSLRSANIDDEGARCIAGVLRGNSVLFSVDLSWNRFGDTGARYLEHAMRENHVLLDLALDTAVAVDGVFFDIEDPGISGELLRRAEAAWRYNPTDQDTLRTLYRQIGDLNLHRTRERERGDRKLTEVGAAQRLFHEKCRPLENKLIQLKEELAGHAEQTKEQLKRNILLKSDLARSMEDLDDERLQTELLKAEAHSLQNCLTQRLREVTESVETLQCSLDAVQHGVDKLLVDNDKCRRELHAQRFETEDERVVPSWVAERAARASGANTRSKSTRGAVANTQAPPRQQPQQCR